MTTEQKYKKNLKISIKQNKNAIALMDVKKQERLEEIARMEAELAQLEQKEDQK